MAYGLESQLQVLIVQDNISFKCMPHKLPLTRNSMFLSTVSVSVPKL